MGLLLGSPSLLGPWACLVPGLLPEAAANVMAATSPSSPSDKPGVSRRVEFHSRQLTDGKSALAASSRARDVRTSQRELASFHRAPGTPQPGNCGGSAAQKAQKQEVAAHVSPRSLGGLPPGSFLPAASSQPPQSLIQICSGHFPAGLCAKPNTISAGPFSLLPQQEHGILLWGSENAKKYLTVSAQAKD